MADRQDGECGCPSETSDWNGQTVTRWFHEPDCQAGRMADRPGETLDLDAIRAANGRGLYGSDVLALVARLSAAESAIDRVDGWLFDDVDVDRSMDDLLARITELRDAERILSVCEQALRAIETIAAEHAGISEDAYEQITDVTRAALTTEKEDDERSQT